MPWSYTGKLVEVREINQEIQIFDSRGILLAVHRKLPQALRSKYSHIVQEEHYRGLAGAEEAFASFKQLNQLGFGPFYVEKRPLREYEEVAV